jgi:hypothetical protein
LRPCALIATTGSAVVYGRCIVTLWYIGFCLSEPPQSFPFVAVFVAFCGGRILCKKSVSFRVGKVKPYLHGKVWYLCYHENGQRRQPRVGPDRTGNWPSPSRTDGVAQVV